MEAYAPLRFFIFHEFIILLVWSCLQYVEFSEAELGKQLGADKADASTRQQKVGNTRATINWIFYIFFGVY